MDTRRKHLNMEDRTRHARRESHPRARQDSVEIARRCFAAFNRSFADGADDYYELLDPDVEWIPLTALLDGRAYRGPEGVRRWLEDVRQDWAVFEIGWNEVRDLGGGRVLAFGVWECQGRCAGVRVSFDQAAWLIDLRAGRMSRLETFVDRGEAIEAAGLLG
jgi:ketosteroid isomerase-like protein